MSGMQIAGVGATCGLIPRYWVKRIRNRANIELEEKQ